MMRGFPFSARGQRMPLAGGLAALVILLIGLAILFRNEQNYQRQRLQETEIQAQILAANLAAAVDFQDVAAAEEITGALRFNPQVRHALVFDGEGALFAGFRRVSDGEEAGAGTIRAVAPVTNGDERIGRVELSVQRESLSRLLTRYALTALFVVFAALVIGILAVMQAALRRANRELEGRAQALAAANEELQVQMAERAKAEEQLRQAQKMQALGQLTGGIAHDFNNLLTVIQGSADILQRPGLADAKRLRFAGAVAETAKRAAALTAQLLAFARRQPLQPQVLDLNEQILGMIDLLNRSIGETVQVETDFGADLCLVKVDPVQLENAVINIAVNARDAMPAGGVLRIRTFEAEEGGEGRRLGLTVEDTGEGMDADTLARVFEPFFTTKETGRGTGLGLSQVYGFAAQSGGEVRIESAKGEGTAVTILLPCTDELRSSPSAAGERDEADGCPPARILVVDDNEDVGAFAESLLVELGHSVVRARSGHEALDIWKQGRDFDIVFTDVVMPDMSGLQLADRIREEAPGQNIILTTGFSDEVVASGTGGLPVLHKPYEAASLAAAVARELRKGAGARAGERV